FSFPSHANTPHLPSFPTRRSSDLLEKLPPKVLTTPDEINLFEIDARAGFDKPARIVSTRIVRGVQGLQEQLQFSAVTSGQLLDADRKSTRLNSSHSQISYAVFCLK